MSLDKAIEHGKEHRKPFTGKKAKNKAARNHGTELERVKNIKLAITNSLIFS